MKTKLKCAAALIAFVAALAAATSNAQAQTKIVFNALSYLDKCAETYSWDTGVCLEALQNFAKKNPQQNFAIAKRARLQFKHWVALQFFEPALGKSPTSAQCADDDLQLAVLSGIALPVDHAPHAVAKRIFGGPCFAALRPGLEKAVRESGGAGYLWQNGCQALVEKGVKLAACFKTESDLSSAVKTTSATAPAIAPKVNLTTAKFGALKVYRGAEGERVTIADVIGAPNTFAIRFDGVRSAWNGKTWVHRESADGNRTLYTTTHNGDTWTSVTVSGILTRQYELFLPDGKGAIPVSFSERDTKEASAEALLKWLKRFPRGPLFCAKRRT